MLFDMLFDKVCFYFSTIIVLYVSPTSCFVLDLYFESATLILWLLERMLAESLIIQIAD